MRRKRYLPPPDYDEVAVARDLAKYKKYSEAVMDIYDQAPEHIRKATHEHDIKVLQAWYEGRIKRRY